MRRNILVLTLAVLIAVMMVLVAAPAFARVSSFISSPTGTQLSLSSPTIPSDPFFPTDPYQPQSTQYPGDPYAPAASNPPLYSHLWIDMR